jgi:hypothetical protein
MRLKRAIDCVSVGAILTSLFPSAANASGAMYVRGAEVFSYPTVRALGGVALQGTADFYDADGGSIPVSSLGLRLKTDQNEKICILHGETCYSLEIFPETGRYLAEWVLTNQTGAYSDWDPYEEGVQESEARWKSVWVEDIFGEGWEGFLPFELGRGLIPNLLYFIDFDILLNEVDDDSIRNEYNSRLGPDFNPEYAYYLDESYINVDTDTHLRAYLKDGMVQLEGLISRYHWIEYEGTEYPYIEAVERACTPESIRTYDVLNCSDLQPISNSIRILSEGAFSPGDLVAFYLKIDARGKSPNSGIEDNKIDSPVVFMSLPRFNSEHFKHFSWNLDDRQFNSYLSWEEQEDGTLILSWEDRIGGGDGDFNDLKVIVKNVSTSDSQGIFKHSIHIVSILGRDSVNGSVAVINFKDSKLANVVCVFT